MIRHLKHTKCNKYIKDVSQQELRLSSSGITTYKFPQEKSQEDLADMIIMHEYSFRMVEHKGFLKFVQNLRP